jgi:hypothetical protein
MQAAVTEAPIPNPQSCVLLTSRALVGVSLAAALALAACSSDAASRSRGVYRAAVTNTSNWGRHVLRGGAAAPAADRPLVTVLAAHRLRRLPPTTTHAELHTVRAHLFVSFPRLKGAQDARDL